jgi:hypothetical protein
MRRIALAALAVGLVVLSGCSSSAPTGSVTGLFETAGGAPGYGPHPLPGTVVFSSPRGTQVSVGVGADGSFSAHLRVATYTAVGHSPRVISDGHEMTCRASRPVAVSSGRTVRVTVECQLM